MLFRSALDAAWRSQMLVLGIIVAVILGIALIFARRSPEYYGLEAFGSIKPPSSPTASGAQTEKDWTVREAFSRYAIWGGILVFLTSMMAEFLVWTQVVSYWKSDMGYSLAEASSIYALIGLVGILGMPLMGRLADFLVHRIGSEPLGRKLMLMGGPAAGALACILLLGSANLLLAYAACVIFALYWAVVPGGVVGYVGAMYGRKTLGRIWGLATLIVMGIGPFLGTFIGGFLRDFSGSYRYSMLFALFSFSLSALIATSLPLDWQARHRFNSKNPLA